MRKELPNFITDPSNRIKEEAILAGRKYEAIGLEKTETLDVTTGGDAPKINQVPKEP
jgi:hypothetical protein